jgi:hypothetical protein
MDLRTKHGRLLRSVRAELLAHVGANPSATQKALIDRAAWLSLHVAMLDAKAIAAGGMPTEHDSRQYLAWSNTLTRTLSAIGLKSAGQQSQRLTLHEHLAQRAQRPAAP